MIKFNKQKLDDLLYDFYNITKTRIVVFDDDFNEVGCYPKELCGFCQTIKSNPTTKLLCDRSDRESCEKCKSTQSIFTYKCHAGLSETVAPLKYNDLIIGYIMFGQILIQAQNNINLGELESFSEEYNFDFDSLKEAHSHLMVIKENQIKSISKILEACACYLWLEEMAYFSEDDIAQKIEKYILVNISESITTNDICAIHNISRSMLYKTFSARYGMGVAEFIRNQRIKQACNLLKTTSYKIHQVSAMVGIDDYNYFTKIFKKHCNCTPQQFCKKHRLLS